MNMVNPYWPRGARFPIFSPVAGGIPRPVPKHVLPAKRQSIAKRQFECQRQSKRQAAVEHGTPRD